MAALLASGALTLAVVATGAAQAGEGEGQKEGFDTEHLFGFAEGSDLGQPGETEVESETTGRFGKRHGRFSAIDSALSLKVPVTGNFRLSPGFVVTHYDIHGAPDQPGRRATTVDGAFLDMRFRLLERGPSPVGLTLSVAPGFGVTDGGTGLPTRGHGADFTLLMDREIIPGKLVGVVNLAYDMGVSRPRDGGVTSRGSGVDLTAGLSWQAAPHVFVGGEVRYARAYEGLALDRFAGQALFTGPTLYTALGSGMWASVAWHVQVAGSANRMPGRLDLDQFERHQVRLRVGGHF